MKRRDFSLAAPAIVLAATPLAATWAQAQSAKPAEGTDYRRLGTAVGVEAPAGKIEVVEFFRYSCPHCNAFEPTLDAWSKKLPPDVVLRRIPIAFGDADVPQQRFYYAMESMGLLPKLHTKVFHAMHVEKLNLTRGDAIIDWVAQQGVDKAKFQDQFNSFSVNSKATKATQMQNGYGVEGVPALGVAGRFYTDGSIARTMERALLVVESLVADVRAKR
ncbi:MAG: disulfide bond formation protein DsbA [Burkholderiales bacterium PBB3]|nr:MAG: disulfide bond formation protein DsbA [Burkholderiales bacterium PBB3]